MTSIFQEIGGDAALAAVTADFYQRVLADTRLAGYFRNTDMARLKRSQAAFLAATLGGPKPYTGLSMTDVHRGRNIGHLQFDLTVGHLTDALTNCGVPGPTVAAILALITPLAADIVTALPAATLPH